MPSGRGFIDEAQVAQIAAAVAPSPAAADTFMLTARNRAGAIAEQLAVAGTTTLQLVDHVPHGELQRLRLLRSGVRLVQVIHVTGEASAAEALAPFVDALLLDSGNPALAVKELGGTGRTHALSRRIRDAVWPLPLYLAGGLSADNVAAAMHAVSPFGLDLCSSVRSQGRLDAARLQAFMAAVAAANPVN